MNTASRGVLPHVSSKSALLLFAGSKMARKADRRASSELGKAPTSFDETQTAESELNVVTNEIESD
jgi:hypothetical protein